MSAFSVYFANKVIDHMLRNQAFTPPTTVYLALFTAVTGLETDAPTAEVSGDTYARQACALDAAASSASANTSEVAFPQAGASWGTITHFALVDHETNVTWGTNVHVLKHGALTTSKAIGAGDTLKVAASALAISIA